MRNQTTTKTCPLINGKCIKTDCEIFDERFDRCTIGLLAYNMYRLQLAITEKIDVQK